MCLSTSREFYLHRWKRKGWSLVDDGRQLKQRKAKIHWHEKEGRCPPNQGGMEPVILSIIASPVIECIAECAIANTHDASYTVYY